MDGALDLFFLHLDWGSIKVWWLGVFGLILDVQCGFCKQISVVFGFRTATRLRKIGI